MARKKIQRCLVHVMRQIMRKTTCNPKLECGRELLKLAKELTKIQHADAAAKWVGDYTNWCTKWENFLREFTLKDGRKIYTHERIRSARHSLNTLVKERTMFTFKELTEELSGTWDSTNNIIEGKFNAQIRLMLRHHRGLSTMRRVKAVFWWCYLHSEFKKPEAEMLREMLTDEQVEGLFALASRKNKRDDGAPEEYSTSLPEWSEMKKSGSYATGWF